MTTANTQLSNQELATEFLRLFKTQYRGIQSVTIENGEIKVCSTVKSAKSLLKVSRDLAIAGFINHKITRQDKSVNLTCQKQA